MLCRLSFGLAAWAFVLCSSGFTLAAAPPSESVFPDTTKAFLSVANWGQLEENFNKTQLGQLMHDPVMKPFAEDIRQQLRDKWTRTNQKLGLAWTDLEGVPSGEIGLAAIQPAKGEAAMAILMDVAGNMDKTNALVEKVSGRLIANGAVRSERDVEGTKVIILTTPKAKDRPAQTAVYAIKNEILLASDETRVVEGMLGRMASQAQDNLAGVPAYIDTMKRCRDSAGDLAPHVRWFIEPFGYVETLRAAGLPRRKGPDLLKILASEGFSAIKGLGGFVNFAAGKYEMLHRTAIYAPQTGSSGERYQLAARMLDFPNDGNLAPQSWVPRDIATYASFHWNVAKAFDASETIVDKVLNEPGVFKEVLLSIKTDPNGPQIDIRNDLVQHLGQRVTVLSDYQLPITPKSERMVFGIEAKDPAAVAQTIERWMKSDPDARKRLIGTHVVWEIVGAEGELPPMVSIENDNEPGEEEEEEAREEGHLPPNTAVTVAFGQLFYATHSDLLTKVLTENPDREKLSAGKDFQLVAAELQMLGKERNCAQTFSRTDEEYRAVYELIRKGRMPEAESMLGKLLNNVLGEGKPGVLRKQKIDGDKLPDFEVVRRYFGPAGMTVTTEDEGWMLIGFTLNKETP